MDDDDILEIKQALRDIDKLLRGNGRGVIERLALLEQGARIGRYFLTVVVGIIAAVATALIMAQLVP